MGYELSSCTTVESVTVEISHARNSALLLRWNWRSSSERRWSDERTKATPALHPPDGSAQPSADRPQRLLTLVAGPSGSHRAGQRPRCADQHNRLSGAVRRVHRLEDLPSLRAAWPDRVAGSFGPFGTPRADFPPSSGRRSSPSPAWSRWPGACTSPTGP